MLDRATSAERVGSRDLRAWIAARQPLLALHGHIHEAPDLLGRWAERLGATLCVNPGAAQGTTVQAAIIETAPLTLRHTTRGPIGL